MWNTLKFIKQHASKYWHLLWTETVISCIFALSAVYFAMVMRNVIDSAVASKTNRFKLAVIQMIVVVLFQMIARYSIKALDERIRSGMENQLKSYTYQKILKSSYEDTRKYHSGELLNRLTSDTVQVVEGIAGIIPNVISMLVRMAGAASLLLYLDLRFSVIFLGCVAALLIISLVLKKRMKDMHNSVQENDGKLKSYLQETIENLLMLISFQGETVASNKAEKYMENHRGARIRKNMFSNICHVAFVGIMDAGYLFGVIWCGFGILHKSITYGTLTAVLRLISQVEGPIGSLTGYLPKYFAMLASAERIMEITEGSGKSISLEDVRDSKKVAGYYKDLTEISFRNVTFSYPDEPGDMKLKDFSFDVKKGEFIAITGHSGIGKSTLLKLLLAVYQPVKGEVVLCMGNREVQIDETTRGLFGYVPQGNHLLSGSIEDVITEYANRSFSDEAVRLSEIKKACEIACCDFIDTLPDKMATVLGEKGAGLSEGQLQRIAIARAIYADAPILLLDESTSALDEATEERVLNNIKALTDKTVFIVTHRSAAVRICDRELILERDV